MSKNSEICVTNQIIRTGTCLWCFGIGVLLLVLRCWLREASISFRLKTNESNYFKNWNVCHIIHIEDETGFKNLTVSIVGLQLGIFWQFFFARWVLSLFLIRSTLSLLYNNLEAPLATILQ